MDPLNILAIEPYAGGSHRAFLEGLQRFSRHKWTIVTLPARHWKWRMRSAPIALIPEVCQSIQSLPRVDLLFSSDMLDLPTWLGLATRHPELQKTIRNGDGPVPCVTYFHENQWTYPQSPNARVDHHFGYTNLLTAIASDACWFNSEYHRDTFVAFAKDFLSRMPDGASEHFLEPWPDRCKVFPPGFPIPQSIAATQGSSTKGSVAKTFAGKSVETRPIVLGWVARWEFDKRPDRFHDLLCRLEDRKIAFELILLGQRGETANDLERIRNRFGTRILHDGYAESIEQYHELLRQIDVVVSTADHEFFGIGVCEAVWAGAVAVVPDELSYREILPPECRYRTLDEAVEMISDLRNPDHRHAQRVAGRKAIEALQQPNAVAEIDEAIAQLIRQRLE